VARRLKRGVRVAAVTGAVTASPETVATAADASSNAALAGVDMELIDDCKNRQSVFVYLNTVTCTHLNTGEAHPYACINVICNKCRNVMGDCQATEPCSTNRDVAT